MGNANDAESDVNLEDFFSKVRHLLEKVSQQVREVEKKHGEILSAPDPQKKSKDELEMLNKETKRTVNLVRAKLKSMQRSFPVDENSNHGSVIQRIQKNQHSDLTRRFVDAAKGYYKAQTAFREKCKERIQRQLDIVGRITTEEELEEMLRSTSPAIFTSKVGHASAAQLTSQALSEIESRHRDILCLESSIAELQDVFADTAMLLELQGDLMNNIEKNVISAAEYISSSKANTDSAAMYKKNRFRIASFQKSPK